MSNIINIRIPNTFVGLGAINNIGDTIKDLSPSKTLIITDPVINKTGLVDSLKAALQKTGYAFEVYDSCESNTSVSSIDRLGQRVRSGKYDLLIGIGGGSVMDATKIASQLGANDGLNTDDLINNRAADKVIAKVLIPTTAGSGSEWSLVAVVSEEKSGKLKKAITSVKNVPDIVIVDPQLTINLPQKVTADTGMDALVHTVEAYTSRVANVFSDMFALTAQKLIVENIRPAYSDGKNNIEARYNMSVAASIAMCAASLSGVGLAHLMGHPIEKRADISHGVACTLLLPYVMEFHLKSRAERFIKIAETMGEEIKGLSVAEAAAKSVKAVTRLSRAFGMPQTLTDIGIKKSQIKEMAEETLNTYGLEIKMWDPCDVSQGDVIKIYTAAL